MRFYRCDRCKKEFECVDYRVTTEHIGLTGPLLTCKCVEFPFDLCDDCRKDFENWFRQPAVDKAFEEAHAKAHAHDKGDVTVLALRNGVYLCPVCGYVMKDPTHLGDICPQCGTLLSALSNYIDVEVGGDGDDTTGTET